MHETLLTVVDGQHGAALTLDVRTLGGFTISCGERLLPLPTRVPAQAVKALAVHGAMHADQLVELLWEECPPDAGRIRLRNVIARIRRLYGTDFLVRVDEAIALGDHVRVDAAEFEAAARNALATRDDELARSAGCKALALAVGELLPYDRYRDWTHAARERLRQLELDLLDLLAALAVDARDLAEAVRLLERAIERDPNVEDRYLLAADLLTRDQRYGRAAIMGRRARAVCERLGVPAPALTATAAGGHIPRPMASIHRLPVPRSLA